MILEDMFTCGVIWYFEPPWYIDPGVNLKVYTLSYDACLFASSFTLSLFALLRVGEITSDYFRSTQKREVAAEK
jgi:hypothetical protein